MVQARKLATCAGCVWVHACGTPAVLQQTHLAAFCREGGGEFCRHEGDRQGKEQRGDQREEDDVGGWRGTRQCFIPIDATAHPEEADHDEACNTQRLLWRAVGTDVDTRRRGERLRVLPHMYSR